MKKKEKSDIRWDNRYSATMENDEMGRWARVAFAGDFSGHPFKNNIPCHFEIAWVKKLIIKDKVKFVVAPKFPYTGDYSFETLELAKQAIEDRFKFFIQNCIN